MTRILRPKEEDNGSIPDELLKEIAQLLAGPDGTAVQTADGWVYDKPKDPTVDGGTVRPPGRRDDT